MNAFAWPTRANAPTAKSAARRHYEAQVQAYGEARVPPWPVFQERWNHLHAGPRPEKTPTSSSKSWKSMGNNDE